MMLVSGRPDLMVNDRSVGSEETGPVLLTVSLLDIEMLLYKQIIFMHYLCQIMLGTVLYSVIKISTFVINYNVFNNILNTYIQ